MTFTFGLTFKLIVCAFAIVGAIGTAVAAAIVAFFMLIWMIS